MRAHPTGSASCRRSNGAPDGAAVYYERHRPEQTTLHGLVRQHTITAATLRKPSPSARAARPVVEYRLAQIITHPQPVAPAGSCLLQAALRLAPPAAP